MAPSKKLDNNGEESQLEPQIPENTYPFSQRFTGNIQDSSEQKDNNETPQIIASPSHNGKSAIDAETTTITRPDTSETLVHQETGEAQADAITQSSSPKEQSSPATMETPQGPEEDKAPGSNSSSVTATAHTARTFEGPADEPAGTTDSEQRQPIHTGAEGSVSPSEKTPSGGPIDTRKDSPDGADKDAEADFTSGDSATLPPIPPQTKSFASSDKREPSNNASDDPSPTRDKISTEGERSPLPASAFSQEDYLTADEAQAYIQGEAIAMPPSGDTKNETAQSAEDTSPAQATVAASPHQPLPSPHSAQATSHKEDDLDKELPQEPLKKRFFGKKKDAPDKGTDTMASEASSKKPGKVRGKKLKEKPDTTPASSMPSSSAQSFFKAHPILRTTPSMPGGLSNAIFNSASFAPWLILTLFFVLQTIFTLDARALWYSDEVRHAAVFTSMLKEGNLFKLELNGQLYPDKPSLYFWFLRGLYEIFQEEGPRLYFAAAAISGLLYLWATLLLGRFAGRFDGRSLLAGGLLLISGSYFMMVTHYARMDLLFSAFILGSYTVFFMAFSKPKAPLLMALAFILGALACLTKGPLGILLPLSALLLFSLWTGKIRRFMSLDFLMGLVIAALIVGGWLVGLYTETSLEYIQDKILGKQVIERAVDAFHHKQGWSYYLKTLPLLLLPWVAIILCLPYHKLLSKNALAIIAASRKPEREGQAYLWCIVLSALLLLSAVSTKIIIYMLPVLPVMCLLAGRAVLLLAGKRAVTFKFLLGLVLLLAGIAIFLATLWISGSLPLPEFVDKKLPVWEIAPSIGFFISTGILCAAALFLFFGLPSSRPEGVLLTLGIMATALAYPLFGLAAPKIDATMSPKTQGEIIKQYIANDYYPLTYDMYDGVYTYYAGANIEEVYSVEDILAKLEEHPRIILAIQERALNKITTMPACFEPIHRQMIEKREYVLLACPPLPEQPATEQEDGASEATQKEIQGHATPPQTVIDHTADATPGADKTQEQSGLSQEGEASASPQDEPQGATPVQKAEGIHEGTDSAQELESSVNEEEANDGQDEGISPKPHQPQDEAVKPEVANPQVTEPQEKLATPEESAIPEEASEAETLTQQKQPEKTSSPGQTLPQKQDVRPSQALHNQEATPDSKTPPKQGQPSQSRENGNNDTPQSPPVKDEPLPKEETETTEPIETIF